MKTLVRRGCLAIVSILFFLFLYQYNSFERIDLDETEGRTFEKAEVIKINKDNEVQKGVYIGNQTVTLRMKGGAYDDEEVTATSAASYLYGTHCTKGKKVIAMVCESNGELTASVYSADRGFGIYAIVGIFVLIIVVIGGMKGLRSVVGLAFTFLCIVYLFLPMIYKGVSPILAALLVVVLTTCATMYLIGGRSSKTFSATVGTILGVAIAGLFAIIFGKITEITGYNVSDIENLMFVRDQTGIKVGELMFSGILIASLGAVMDVAMSISSTIEEIHAKNPDMTARELFQSGMNVGKDMMGTMSNTLILAFAGGSINTIVFLYAYNYEYLQVVNMYSLGIEILQGIASSIGVILTVPIVSAIASIKAHQGKKSINSTEF